MPLFVWDEIYRVGIAAIDEQHQRLFDIVNRFHDAVLRREGRWALVSLFDELAEYTVYHFREEEQRMAEVGYPDLSSHRGYHQRLVGLVATYRQQLADGVDGIEARAVDFIKMWLNAHVLGTDKDIGRYALGRRGAA
jgi:hemerythrin-like metal-binding protein